MKNRPGGTGPEAGFRPDAPAIILMAAYISAIVLTIVFAGLKGFQGRDPAGQLFSVLTLIALTMILCQFIISRFIRLLSKKYRMRNIISFHQTMGLLLTVIVLLHPFLALSATFWTSFVSDLPGGTYRLITSPRLGIGVAGYILFVASTAGCLLRDSLPVRYVKWRMIHGAGWVVIAVLSTRHALEIGSHSNIFLAALWTGLLIVGLTLTTITYLSASKHRYPAG